MLSARRNEEGKMSQSRTDLQLLRNEKVQAKEESSKKVRSDIHKDHITQCFVVRGSILNAKEDTKKMAPLSATCVLIACACTRTHTHLNK